VKGVDRALAIGVGLRTAFERKRIVLVRCQLEATPDDLFGSHCVVNEATLIYFQLLIDLIPDCACETFILFDLFDSRFKYTRKVYTITCSPLAALIQYEFLIYLRRKYIHIMLVISSDHRFTLS